MFIWKKYFSFIVCAMVCVLAVFYGSACSRASEAKALAVSYEFNWHNSKRIMLLRKHIEYDTRFSLRLVVRGGKKNYLSLQNEVSPVDSLEVEILEDSRGKKLFPEEPRVYFRSNRENKASRLSFYIWNMNKPSKGIAKIKQFKGSVNVAENIPSEKKKLQPLKKYIGRDIKVGEGYLVLKEIGGDFLLFELENCSLRSGGIVLDFFDKDGRKIYSWVRDERGGKDSREARLRISGSPDKIAYASLVYPKSQKKTPVNFNFTDIPLKIDDNPLFSIKPNSVKAPEGLMKESMKVKGGLKVVPVSVEIIQEVRSGKDVKQNISDNMRMNFSLQPAKTDDSMTFSLANSENVKIEKIIDDTGKDLNSRNVYSSIDGHQNKSGNFHINNLQHPSSEAVCIKIIKGSLLCRDKNNKEYNISFEFNNLPLTEATLYKEYPKEIF